MVLFVFIGINANVFAEGNVITIDCNRELGIINNKMIFGQNFIGYDPLTYEYRAQEYYGYADYGAGLWDPKGNKSVKEVTDLAKEAGMTVVRFPGGCGTHHYNWKNAIGKNRAHFLFGIDEFLKTAEEIGSEVIITVSYFTGDEQDAADLVEYLNCLDDGSNPNGEIDWARERTKNGHPLPYNVRYFEIGNEVKHGDHQNKNEVLPEEYATRYLKYYQAMKAVDSQIKIGVVLDRFDWDSRVLEVVKDKLDFGIIHTYPGPQVNRNKLEQMNPQDIFAVTLGVPLIKDEYDFQRVLKILKEKSGKEIPLAITEYNGEFVQESPVPYRHCLGTALLNAELLRVFMRPEHNIFMANYWQFCNSYWGAIKAKSDFMSHDYSQSIDYIKRPNFYVYQLYNQHFGDILLEADVQGAAYDITKYRDYIQRIITQLKGGVIIKRNLLGEAWKISQLSGINVQQTGDILEIEFARPQAFNYYHSVKRAQVRPDAYYKLSGYIKTEGLVDEEGVCLEVLDARGWDKTHSAAATEKITGTQDWQYVETVYLTLPDAKEVKIIARRIGEQGPLQGRAYFKDVKLQRFIPVLNTDIPYLSVNASKTKDGNRLYLMVINKNMDQSITATVELKNFVSAYQGDAWILNGPGVDATNEKQSDNVKLTHRAFDIAGDYFRFSFAPHSLTAIEIERWKE